MRHIDRLIDLLERPRSAVTRGFAVAAIAAALIYLVSFRQGTPLWFFNEQEGGLWLDEAAQVLDGQVMYRDFFEFLAPGVVYVDAFFLALLGRSAVAAQVITVAVGTALTWLLWRISTRCLSASWQVVPPLVFACLIYPRYSPGNHKWITWTCALIGVDLLMSKRPSSGRVVLAGLFTGASVLSTQDMGAALFLGTLAGLWPRTDGRGRIGFLLGGAVVPVLALGYFVVRAGPGTMWQDLYVFPSTRYGNANGGFAFLPYPSWQAVPIAAVQWAIVCGSIASGTALLWPGVRSRLALEEPADRWLTVVGPGLAVVIVSSWSRSIEPIQMSVRCTLLTVALTGVLEGASRRWPGVVRVMATTLVVFVVSTAAWNILRRQAGATTLVQTRAGQIWSMGPLADLEWLQSQTTPGERVFLFPDKGGYHFLTHTVNATTYPFLQDMSLSSPEQVADAAAQIERGRPRVGIFDLARLFSGGPIGSSSLSALYQFVAAHYRSEDGKRFILRDATDPAR